jgi:hypothetical protein
MSWLAEVAVHGSTHQVALTHLGLAFGGMFDLDVLADDCAQDDRHTFMLAAPSLPLTGAVGSRRCGIRHPMTARPVESVTGRVRGVSKASALRQAA